MTLVDAHHGKLGIRPTCEAVGVSRATWYRRRSRASGQSPQVRTRSHPRRIGRDERARILAVLCEERFADLTPRQVHAALLSEGTYLCSPSSMYRILRESDRGALNRSTPYERLSRPKGPRGVSDEAFEQEASPTRGGGCQAQAG